MHPVSMPLRNNRPTTQDDSKVQALGIIGGSGLARLEALQIDHQEVVDTPYGSPSAALTFGQLNDSPVIFLPRHGAAHSIPPHCVNYRANLWAMKKAGVGRVVGVAAVGGITPGMAPGSLCVPDQIIDYTWGRQHTLYEGSPDGVTHIDFTTPYCETLRKELLHVAEQSRLVVSDGGTYAATQGPRLETAAEIRRLERDGCDVVGMTGMPEASLARELGLCYAGLALSVNWAAGKTEGPISMTEIETYLEQGMSMVMKLLARVAAG